jgi:hypothetical protein
MKLMLNVWILCVQFQKWTGIKPLFEDARAAVMDESMP